MIKPLRVAFRQLVRNPGFSFFAIVALALGIGTTTTVFSAFNAVFLRPTPLMQDQNRIVYLSEYLTQHPESDAGVSYPDFLEWRKGLKSFDGVAAFQWKNLIVSGAENPERYAGLKISANAFSLLGVQPILGRDFRPEEDRLNAPLVVLIGYEVWQNRFGGDRATVGRKILVDGKPATVIGVMPRGWRFPDVVDLWMPLQLNEKEHPRGAFSLQAVGKLKKGASLAQARAELATVEAGLATAYPETNTGRSAHVNLLREQMTGGLREPLLLVMGAVLLVQLIACGNLANLLLARGATRAPEFAIRFALGAQRGQVVRQLLIESLVIGSAGCFLGLVFTWWGTSLLRSAFPTQLPYWVRFDFDWRIGIFAVATGLFSTLLFGLFPALRVSRPHLIGNLKEMARGGGKSERARNALVVAQMALAVVLLIGASLLLRTLYHLESLQLGIDPAQTLTFRLTLPPGQFPNAQAAARFVDDLVPKLRDLPGVVAAGAASSFAGTGVSPAIAQLEGDPRPTGPGEGRAIMKNVITPGFLRTVRMRLLRGRDFAPADSAAASRVALIDERAAALWFPGQDAVGHLLRTTEAGDPSKWATIVGVVNAVAYDRSTKATPLPAVYFPLAQDPQPFMAVAMRTKTDPSTFAQSARQVVQSLNPGVPLFAVETMNEVLAGSFWSQKFFGSIFVVFSALALLLSSLGLYGVIAYSVQQRTQEIGVRMALGAQAGDVLRLVASRGLRLIALGLAAGLVLAFFLSRLLASSLDGVSAHDPVSFIGVPLFLLAVGLFACYLPARAAVQLDPMEALRHD